MKKISLIKFEEETAVMDKKLTECFFKLVEKILLSTNLKFPIEKIHYLPSNLSVFPF